MQKQLHRISSIRLNSSTSMNRLAYVAICKLLIVCSVGSLLVSCKKPKIEKAEPWGFHPESYFPQPVYNFENNQQSYERFQLGATLFYDPILSSDSTISCETCHAQTHVFGGHNTPVSAGVGGALGTRNSPAIFNLAWSPAFMWDGGINHIEVMPIGPITNPVEMNETLAHVVSKLNHSERYRALFKKAYGTNQITDQLLLKALTQYMMMIISDNAKYDQVRRGETVYSATEQAGYDLFVQKCSQCHTEPLFTDYSYRNNGLDATFTTDLGRAHITKLPEDEGKFKVPSLRNVAKTYPYMHDGRFFTLNQVLDHYTSGIQHSSTLDPMLDNGIPLTGLEKQQLIAFLKTLTDYELINNAWLFRPQE